jgi:Na+-transporting methylmalonyl-CoA/oxaloacetate decarboxylase gamma subunit
MYNILLNINDLNAENATIAFVGIFIVFSSLTFLYLFFRTIPLLIEWQTRMRLKRKGTPANKQSGEIQLSSEVAAAISASLYLFLGESHDEENAIMTIKKISKAYSPWSSKIYSMRWPLK